MQADRNPIFFWEKPSKNADVSNSNLSGVIYKDIVGYYYAFNKDRSYFITKIDNYIEQSELEYTSVNIVFPTSGTYYFHIRAVNSAGNVSRNTSHAEVIYNNPPTRPTVLMFNGLDYYSGPSNYNVYSWNESSYSDSDDISYEISIYKNNELFYNDYISAYRCKESIFYGKLEITGNLLKPLFGILNIDSSNSISISDSFSGYEYSSDYVKRRYPGRIYYIYNKDVSENHSGNYYYIVRGVDWAEQSQWSSQCYYDIYPVDVSFDSAMWIGYPDNDKSLTGKMFIKGEAMIIGGFYILPSLYCRMNICEISNSMPLHISMTFKEYLDVFGKIDVDTNFSDIFGKVRIDKNYIYGKLNISCIPKDIDLYCKIRILYDSFGMFFGKMIFRKYYDLDIFCRMFVIANGHDGFYGMMKLIRERMSAKMKIYRILSFDSDYDSKSKLYCKMNIDNYPPAPIVTSDVGNDWQDSYIVNLTWTVPQTRVNVVAFEYVVLQNRVEDFSDLDIPFLRTNRYNVTINLKSYNDDGIYYFYIRSIAANGNTSSPTEYMFKYNNIPSIPSFPMLINDLECINNSPLISKSEYNVFSWKKSTHVDSDVVKYQLQISESSNFSSIIVDVNDISDITESDMVSVDIKYNYSDENNIFYWRVRAYDMYQYSDYGYIGKFKCNTKPGVPTNLRAENEV